MKKDTIRAMIALAVLLVLYLLVVFLIPFVHSAVFWVSFVFTLAAFAVMAVAVYIAFVKNPDAKSKFYGFPIARIGVIYGAAQLIVGLVFMALSQWIPVTVAVIVYAAGLGAAVIGLISAEAVVTQIHVQDEKLKKDVSLMRNLQSKVNQMASASKEPALKQLAEEIRYSDPVSNDAIADAEADLAAAVDQLQAAFVDGDNEAMAQLCRKADMQLLQDTATELDITVDQYQSNHEGCIVDKIQEALGDYDGIVINPAAYTHTSIAILDALKAVSIPAVEVHISDVSEREAFRQFSYAGMACEKSIIGHGLDGYREAIVYLKEKYET